MEGDRPESAENQGRMCSICLLPVEEDIECPTCCQIGNRLTDIQQECETTSLIRAIEALKEWSQDTPTWDVLYWLNQFLQPSVFRGRRMTGNRQGLFLVFEGIDGSGKTFHLDAVKEALISQSRAVHSVVFPNNRTPLGRFLKDCLNKGRSFTAWTYHVLFAIHRWEFMDWITTTLSQGEVVLCERYTWSGVVYSSILDPTLHFGRFMSIEKGLIAPDLVVYIDTPPSRIVGKHAISSLFDDDGFQLQLYELYSRPDLWTGIPVLKHGTHENKWESSMALVQTLALDPRITTTPKIWSYLWEDNGPCGVCSMLYTPQDPVQECYGCFSTVHHHCLMEDWRAERFPLCCACGGEAPEPPPPLPPPEHDPPGDSLEQEIQPTGPDASEPEVSTEFMEQLQGSGSTPCALHGMDHLSHDPTCEYCKRALGPMYRHLRGKYGPQIADHTPTLSFDFSGPLPAAVTGARYLMVFVWRLQEVRLIWAFALDRRTKENVLSCLQSVVADLTTLTGGSKPPVARVHSDQAKEFLSHMVMEWLKDQGIRQTFTSTYDSQANGVAERWINLIKTKATVLLASKYMHTSFWCYAVAWVARCYNQKVLGQKPRKNLPEFGQLLLVRTKRHHKLEERGCLGIMAGTYPDIPNGVIVLSVNNHSIQEIYTAHVAPATFSDKDRWFVKRDRHDPNKIVYVSQKGEVSWDIPLSQLSTVEERIPIKHHPHYAALQRAVDGWAWYTSNVGQLLPHFNDIEPEEGEEPLPQIGGAKYHTWHEVTGELLNPAAQQRLEEKELPPLVQIVPEPDLELPHAPSGRPPFRKIEGSLFLPEAVASDVQRQAEAMDENLVQTPHSNEEEHSTHSPEEREHFPSLGGGVPSPFIRDEEAGSIEDADADVAAAEDDKQIEPPSPGPSNQELEGESDDEVIQQPIPFQMGITPVPEEREPEDELHTWYERTEEQEPQATGSTDPAPKSSPKQRPNPTVKERSPRNLRNRQVARSIQSQPKAKVHWNLQAHGRTYRKGMSPEQMKMEWDLHEPDMIQVHLDRQHDLIEEYPKWHKNWSLLKDPVGRGMSEVLDATVQHVRTTKKEMKRLMKTIPLDPFQMENGYTVLSAELSKQLDKQERAYQKVFLNAICGQGKMLTESSSMLDAVQDLGITHREFKRNTRQRINTCQVPVEGIHPWDTVINQTKLLEQEVPSFFQDEVAMREVYLPEEEVLQTTTCSTRDIYEDIEGWRGAFTKELDSFDRLDVKTDVWENTLDKTKVEILPGKVVMVKKPIGDGTHLKKGRVVVCGNFQQVQPGEETCANTPSFPMLRTLISLASLQNWAVASWDVSTAFLYAQLPEDHIVYCRPPNALIRLGLVQPGVVWKLNKALYGLRTSPKAWEEERDEKLQNLTWSLNGKQVGLSKVDSANCVWVIKEKTDTGFQGEPLGMVIAYVDDLIAVGQQDQLDGMKASLDALYTMKTSGAIPANYQAGTEPLKFLGCFIERLPDGEIIMHQRSYIDHCLKANDMMMLKPAKGLPCVDEKSPPEDPYEEDGTPTSFEADKAKCQKYIGQLMWLTTRTRPDIAATLGILASQMVIRPGYIKGCLVHLWRFILGTKDLNMHSFKPASIDYGSLVLNVYVDASFASGGGRSRSGLAMYLVNPKNGTESLIQWASRRQTSMATSAPEAEVSAMAEGYATSIFLFDTLSELGLVSGSGPSALMSMKTDSAVALKQLGTQSVTVRTRTAAQKLTYLRELIYENPQVEPIYISGDSQRADGLTKILSGKSLSDSQESLNLLPSAPLITGVQEERVSAVQSDTHAHVLEDTQIEADAPRVCTFRMDRQDESSSLDSQQEESRIPLRHSTPQGHDDPARAARIRDLVSMLHPPSRMVQSGTGKRGRKQPPGGEAPGDQSRQTSEAGTAGSGPRQSDLREQARLRALQNAVASQSLNAPPSTKVARHESRSMESSSATQSSVNLAPQGSSMETEPVIPSVEVDESPKSSDPEMISSPHTRPIDLEEEDEEEEEDSPELGTESRSFS